MMVFRANMGDRLDNNTIDTTQMIISLSVTLLDCKIEHFGSRLENVWRSQFANQYSRFTPLMHNSRYVWKFLDVGKMLVIDSFMDTSSVFKILSNTPSHTPISVMYYEQLNQADGLVVYSLNKHFYLSTTHLHFDQGLLEVDFEKSVDIWDLNTFSYSTVSIDWSKTHHTGIVLLGRYTSSATIIFFFTLTDDGEIKILKRQVYKNDIQGTKEALPLFYKEDTNGEFVMFKHCDKWSYFKDAKNNFEQRVITRNFNDSRQNLATRFNSVWLNLDQNLFISPKIKYKYGFHLYNRQTKTFQKIEMPQMVLSQINESLSSSMFICKDDVMLICSERKPGKAMNVTRILLRKPDSFVNLTIISYRQSKHFNEFNTFKLQNCLFPQKNYQNEGNLSGQQK